MSGSGKHERNSLSNLFYLAWPFRYNSTCTLGKLVLEVRRVSEKKRIVLSISQQLLEQVDGIAQRRQTNRSEVIREAMRQYVVERRKDDIRIALQQGYLEMAPINLRMASEAFFVEQEAGGTVERLVSGV